MSGTAATTSGQPFPWAAAASTVSGLFGAIGARRRQRRQHRYNMKLAEYSFDRNKEMWQHAWDTETAYNDPSAQMARYAKAGINPHMAYMKGGGVNTAQTGQLPQYEQEGTEIPENLGQATGDIMQKYFHNKQMEYDLREKKSRAKQSEIETLLKAEGLSEKLAKEGLSAKKDRKRIQAELRYLFGVNREAPHYDSGRKFTRYEEGLQADLDFKKVNIESQKVQQHLQNSTAKNLISNDELIEIQTKIANAESELVTSEAFRKLPLMVRASIIGLLKKVGAM